MLAKLHLDFPGAVLGAGTTAILRQYEKAMAVFWTSCLPLETKCAKPAPVVSQIFVPALYLSQGNEVGTGPHQPSALFTSRHVYVYRCITQLLQFKSFTSASSWPLMRLELQSSAYRVIQEAVSRNCSFLLLFLGPQKCCIYILFCCCCSNSRFVASSARNHS